jgi:hypothetical protein
MVDPRVWGPLGWGFMISVSLAYPERPTAREMIAYRNFYKAIGEVLPCPICAENYRAHLTQVPIEDYLVSRGWLFKWLEIQYALMAKDAGKPALTFPELVKKYVATRR